MYISAEPAFHLRLVGSRDPDGGPMEEIPDSIATMVDIWEDLPYTEVSSTVTMPARPFV